MEIIRHTAAYVRKNEDTALAVMFAVLVAISFINEAVYEAAGRYSSLFMFLVLGILVAAHIGEIYENKDLRFIVFIFIGIAAMTNLVILDSNKGAVLIPLDLSLIVLAASYVRLKEKAAFIISACGSILTLIWYFDVRWSYNFNMAGLTFMLFMIMGVIFLELLKERTEYDYLTCVQVLMFVTAFIYATLYHSRCAMAGIAAFGLFFILGSLIERSGVLFTILLILTTVGSLVFTIAYVIIAGKGMNATFLYKDLISGRHLIWKELWGAFLEHPLTGIGSSYELKSFEIFEVHNGFLDLLTVHGIIVFFPLFILILSAMNNVRLSLKEKEGSQTVSRMALAALFAMFVASFFENFFITSPYSAFFLIFLLMTVSDL